MQDIVHTEEDAQGIQYRLLIEVDETPIKGSAYASGNDTVDRAAEDEIHNRLNNGEIWAWCMVECQAVFHGFVGFDYLGACSYDDTNHFIQPETGGYWQDMKDVAKADLLHKLIGASVALIELERTATKD